MKKILALLITLLAGFSVHAQPVGAWYATEGDKQYLLLLVDDYLSLVSYKKGSGAFDHTLGGPYQTNQKEMTCTLQYHSADAGQVGKKLTASFRAEGDGKFISTVDGQELSWQQVDNNTENALSGVWWISGRKEGEKMTQRELRDRRTLKILTGTKFQWVAINIKTGEFSGTGGGTYEFADNRYTEHIEFFSRDDSRVGASLSFNGALKDGHWHHSGNSSKGDPIYEIWSKLSSASR